MKLMLLTSWNKRRILQQTYFLFGELPSHSLSSPLLLARSCIIRILVEILTYLVSLDLYMNNLNGQIPDTLGKLQKLRFLYGLLSLNFMFYNIIYFWIFFLELSFLFVGLKLCHSKVGDKWASGVFLEDRIQVALF